jgi:hypothetical protein
VDDFARPDEAMFKGGDSPDCRSSNRMKRQKLDAVPVRTAFFLRQIGRRF